MSLSQNPKPDEKNKKSDDKPSIKAEFFGAFLGELIGVIFLAFPLFFAYLLFAFGMVWLIIPMLVCCVLAYRYWRKKL
ncbi:MULTISPECIES: hypothetical protein [unclassified Acinetobacter]|uniref:hypothetical protein n=1 Tax=unclassified Acinetobacter TaxID=196816 RepID=UPI0035BB0F08